MLATCPDVALPRVFIALHFVCNDCTILLIYRWCTPKTDFFRDFLCLQANFGKHICERVGDVCLYPQNWKQIFRGGVRWGSSPTFSCDPTAK
jgi:hypothetical protein